MNQYNIYNNPSNLTEAVKQGWSWPAFCFSWIWCLVKKMYGLGIAVLGAILVMNIITAASDEMAIIGFLLLLGLAIYLGKSGNSLREKNLMQRGYELKTTVQAANPEGAIATFLKENAEK